MLRIAPKRWAGLMMLGGVALFSAAAIVAEPFEQTTATALYQAIATHNGVYRLVNLLAILGLGLLCGSALILMRGIRNANPSLALAAALILSAGTLLWSIEVVLRLFMTIPTAQAVLRGAALPTAFPGTVGIGFEPLFLIAFGVVLLGLAVVVWSAGAAGVLAHRIAQIGAVLVGASGALAALTYPWVGGVERALFYPLVLVLLPFALVLLVRRVRRPALATTSNRRP